MVCLVLVCGNLPALRVRQTITREKTRDKLNAGGGWKVALRSVAAEAEG